MALGIIHFLFLVDAFVMTICTLLLFRRYFEQRTLLTLIFSTFLLSFSTMCYAYFARGLYAMNTEGSILLYRFSILVTVIAPALLAIFVLYPIVLEGKEGSSGQAAKLILLIGWIVTAFSVILTIIGEASYRYTVDTMDIYQLTFGIIPYIGILLGPVVIALLDAFIFGLMIRKETEPFYKTRAILLFLGWILALVGQILLLSPDFMILNPILFGAGTFIMAIAILRRP